MDSIYKEMGKRMRTARTNLGFTQEQVSEMVGIEPPYYGQLERGKKVPSLQTLIKIGKCLKVPVSLLLSKDQNRKEFVYQNIRGMMQDLSERERKFVAGLLRAAVNHLKKVK